MFNFGKKMEKDPQKALDNAKKTMNSGITGGLTKAFMGKEFVNDMNGAMDQFVSLHGLGWTDLGGPTAPGGTVEALALTFGVVTKVPQVAT